MSIVHTTDNHWIEWQIKRKLYGYVCQRIKQKGSTHKIFTIFWWSISIFHYISLSFNANHAYAGLDDRVNHKQYLLVFERLWNTFNVTFETRYVFPSIQACVWIVLCLYYGYLIPGDSYAQFTNIGQTYACPITSEVRLMETGEHCRIPYHNLTQQNTNYKENLWEYCSNWHFLDTHTIIYISILDCVERLQTNSLLNSNWLMKCP